MDREIFTDIKLKIFMQNRDKSHKLPDIVKQSQLNGINFDKLTDHEKIKI